MGQKLNAWNMSDGTVQVHAVGCQHKPGSGNAKAHRQDQVEFGKTSWASQEAFGRDYWDNGILAEYESDHGEGSFDVLQEMDFKPCVTIPTYDPKSDLDLTPDEYIEKIQKENSVSATHPGENAGPKTNKAAAKHDKAPAKDLPGKAPNEVPPPRSPKSKALPGGLCRCGCGQEVGRTSTFAQGHDAKFVSQLLTKVTTGEITEADAIKQTVDVSEALCGKMQKALANATDGAAKKEAAEKAKAEKKEKADAVKAAAKAKAAKSKAEPVAKDESGLDEDDLDDLDDESEDDSEDDDF